jgi:chaperone required for assembly of F1-ATPase
MKLARVNSILLAVAISTTLIAGINLPASVLAAGTAVVSVSAPTQPVSSGNQFTINIIVQPNTAIAGAQFNLSFNPSLVSVNSVTEGNLFTQGGGSTYFMPGTINNITGSVTGVAGTITTPGKTVSTTGTLAVITLTAGTSKATSTLTLSNVIVGDINGQSVSVSMVNSQVSIDHTPVLNSIGSKSVNEGALLSYTISATDPDGDTLTYSASNLPTGANFNASTQTFSWTPTFSQAGSYLNVHFQVSDGSLTAAENITITVNNVNRPPVLNSIGSKSVNEGALLSFIISATDPDGDTLTYSPSNLPTGANFNASTQTFSWTPTFSQAGSYPNVHFQVSDGSLTASENITITVNNVNRPPVLNSIGSKSVNEGALLSYTISATDPDGDTLTYSASNLPTGANFNTSTQTFSWTPTFSQAGSYPNVHFQVSDGSLTAAENITITVVQQYASWDPNMDGSVNVLDMISIGQHWSETGIAGWIPQDVNGDGVINVLDMVIIGQHWTG